MRNVTLICVFILVQLNKCVVACGSVLQRGHGGDGCCLRRFCLNINEGGTFDCSDFGLV